VLAQWAAVYRAPMSRPWVRIVLALAAFPVASGLTALVQRFVWDYWPSPLN
jgi:hypothetical protein